MMEKKDDDEKEPEKEIDIADMNITVIFSINYVRNFRKTSKVCSKRRSKRSKKYILNFL